jgi:PAS domain S-box-containing protein
MALLAAFKRSGDGVYAVDSSQRIVYWSKSAERLLGRRAQQALGRFCYDVIAGGDRRGHPFCRQDCPVIQCSLKGRASENYEVVTRTAGGQSRWLSVSIVVLRGRGPKSTLTVHLIRDVTEKRRVEVRAERILAAVASASPEPDSGVEAAPLTRRETEVLQLLACGLPNRDIASALGVSQTTVRNHIEHLLGKLGVHSKLEAVVYAARHAMA